MRNFNEYFLRKSLEIIEKIDTNEIEMIAKILNKVREQKGRLFVIGSGGGAVVLEVVQDMHLMLYVILENYVKSRLMLLMIMFQN